MGVVGGESNESTHREDVVRDRDQVRDRETGMRLMERSS